jgi:hypothetical protein
MLFREKEIVMKMFESIKASKEAKKKTVEKIDSEIAAGDKSAKEMAELVSLRSKVKLNGVEATEFFKGAMNVIVVGIIIVFEFGHIMNQKASRFLKVL